jgi:hypothetical protein
LQPQGLRPGPQIVSADWGRLALRADAAIDMSER